MADATISIGADASAFTAAMAGIRKNTETMASSITARLARFGQALQGVGMLAGGVKTAFGAVADVGKAVLEPAAQTETLQMQFKVMMGSEEKALDFYEKLEHYANTTPFGLAEIANTAKNMLAMTGMSADEVMAKVMQLGDVAALSGRGVEDLGYMYSKAFNVGLTNEVVEMFEQAGVAVRNEIARMEGVDFATVFEGMSRREYGMEALDEVLDSMTERGGKFHQGVEKLGETLAGRWSTLMDGVRKNLQEFGLQVLPEVKEAVEMMQQAVEAAVPGMQRLGAAVAAWMGKQVESRGKSMLDQAVEMLPELVNYGEVAVVQMGRLVDTILMIPNALGEVWSGLQKVGYFMHRYVTSDDGLGEAWNRASRAVDARSGEAELKRRAEQRRRDWEKMLRESDARRNQVRAAAQAAAESARYERELWAAEKELADERRGEQIRNQKALAAVAAEKEKAQEAELRAYEAYVARRAAYVQKMREQEREQLSIQERESEMRWDAMVAGLDGDAVSGDVIRGRMDALAQAGAAEHAAEIEQLERLLDRWHDLEDAKRAYAENRKETMAELRIQALEATGQQAQADALRAEEQKRRRINELTAQGFSDAEAAAVATLEARVRQLNELQRGTRTEWIQDSRASYGAGGVSHRISSMQDATRAGNKLLSEIKQLVRDIYNKKDDGTAVAVLG